MCFVESLYLYGEKFLQFATEDFSCLVRQEEYFLIKKFYNDSASFATTKTEINSNLGMES